MKQQLKNYIAPLSISLIALLFTIQATGLYTIFRFDRSFIQQGEIWRIFTGNLVHADIMHWLLNMAGLLILWTMYHSQVTVNKLLTILIIASFGTCLGLFMFEPQLRWYVGLSGALHGLFSACIILAFSTDRKLQTVLALLLAGKLFYEQFIGAMPGSDEIISVPVIVNSHLYGAITGMITGAIITLTSRKK